jgi:hypothetical protein
MPLYKNTQIGYMVIIPSIILIVIIILVPFPKAPVLLFPLVLIGTVIIVALFATLTVEVTEVHLKFRFGIGIIHKRILISDIASCKATHTLMPSWGISRTRRGWLYNISGFNLVEITLKNGKQLFLGTDELEDLCNVITKAITISTKGIQRSIRYS